MILIKKVFILFFILIINIILLGTTYSNINDNKDIYNDISIKLENEGEVNIEELKKINDNYLLSMNVILISHTQIFTIEDIEDEATIIIKEFEGFSHTPYWDHKWYSIWYWTPSNWRAYISETQALNEVKSRVKIIREKMDNTYWLEHIDPAMKISLISFFYNVNFRDSIIKLAKENKKDELIKEMLLYNKASWKRLPWLVDRRIKETDYLRKNYNLYEVK